MNSPFAEATARRVAELHLRSPDGRLAVRVLWPHQAPGRPAVAVLYPGAAAATEALGHALCAHAGMLVVSSRTAPTTVAAGSVVEWIADHGVELGADPRRLLVAGAGTGGALAAAVALHARDRGWPPIARQILVLPEIATAPAPLTGVAPATVVSALGDSPAHRYAERLRASGVAVDELRGDPDDRLLSDLAASLR
jgi:hypothetical protein